MKLKTKLTILCAALLFAVAVSLTAAMLWQVREQSYGALFGSTEETLNDLVENFGTAVYRSPTDGLDALSRKALLTYCFRSCGVPGSALVVNGECLSASAHRSTRNAIWMSITAARNRQEPTRAAGIS